MIPYNPIRENNLILWYDLDYLKSEWNTITIDDLDLIRSNNTLWISNFSLDNINAIEENFWNTTIMQIILFIQDFTLNNNPLVKMWILDKNDLFHAYTFLFWKLLTRNDIDVNIKSFNNSTLLSHIIWFNEINFLKFILNIRKDLDIENFESKFWNSYLDLAKWLKHYEIAFLLEEEIKNRKS